MSMDNRKPHILVVDDEPVMRTITESVLAQQEFEVSTANSAEQAGQSHEHQASPSSCAR